MNIALILSGGMGRRFGTPLPKQYNQINGKAVIDYVIEACLGASKVDRVVVACDFSYLDCSRYLGTDKVCITPNGKERYDSLRSGLEYIRTHFACKNVCIFDAVAPLVTPALIDSYFEKLEEYDCVITCQKITGELGNYQYDILQRSDYYITQSPEAFRFELLMRYFDPAFYSSELANQLPKDTKRYLNFDFKENIKITYDFDLELVKRLLEQKT